MDLSIAVLLATFIGVLVWATIYLSQTKHPLAMAFFLIDFFFGTVIIWLVATLMSAATEAFADVFWKLFIGMLTLTLLVFFVTVWSYVVTLMTWWKNKSVEAEKKRYGYNSKNE